MRRIENAALAAVVCGAVLVGGAQRASARFTYHPNDYRRGEIAHSWPKRGVWQVMLRAGGSDGSDTCDIATKAGAQEPTFLLMFSDDGSPGGDLTLTFGDTNPAPMNMESIRELKTTLTVFPPAPPNAPSWARRPGTDVRGGWQLAMVPHVGSIGLIDGLRFYVVKDWLVAWNMPNRGGNSPFRGDGPKALSTNEMLSRMAK